MPLILILTGCPPTYLQRDVATVELTRPANLDSITRADLIAILTDIRPIMQRSGFTPVQDGTEPGGSILFVTPVQFASYQLGQRETPTYLTCQITAKSKEVRLHFQETESQRLSKQFTLTPTERAAIETAVTAIRSYMQTNHPTRNLKVTWHVPQ